MTSRKKKPDAIQQNDPSKLHKLEEKRYNLLNHNKEQSALMDQYLNLLNSKKHSISDQRKKNSASLNNDENTLSEYCINLNQMALANKLDNITLRKKELDRTIEIVSRRKKNNIILVGEPGVGKTAIAESLALAIVNKQVPHFLENHVIYSLSIGNLLSGTKYRGDFEQKIKLMLETIKNNSNIIIFIDEIHNLIGAGSSIGNSLDASNLLKPALANGEFRCIGATTLKEYKTYFEKDLALTRRFQKIHVSEPTKEDTLNMLKSIKIYYEKHHNVTYTEKALKRAIELSCQYIHNRKLPDKAIDLIDEAGAQARILNDNDKKISVTHKNIEQILRKKIGVNSSFYLNDSSNIRHLNILQKKLTKSIIGQNNAIQKICDAMKISHLELDNTKKVKNSLLFIGPNGVGKKSLAKKISQFCHMGFFQFDMKEYSDYLSINKLVNTNYLSNNTNNGLLINAVESNPYSILLFDNIYEAHSSVIELIKKIISTGEIMDCNDMKISFANTIIILTHNVKPSIKNIGFIKNESTDNNKTVNSNFSKYVNKTITFNSLLNVIPDLIQIRLKNLIKQLETKNITLKINSSLVKYLVSLVKQQSNIISNINNIVDSKIKSPLIEKILSHELNKNHVINIEYNKKIDQIDFLIKKNIGNNKLDKTKILEVY